MFVNLKLTKLQFRLEPTYEDPNEFVEDHFFENAHSKNKEMMTRRRVKQEANKYVENMKRTIIKVELPIRAKKAIICLDAREPMQKRLRRSTKIYSPTADERMSEEDLKSIE